jgi:hypothetical protein
VLYHLIAGRPLFDSTSQSAMMNQIYSAEPTLLSALRSGVGPGVDSVILSAVAKRPEDRYTSWDDFAQALSSLITNQQVPRGHLQGVLDSERFNLLRTLDFFSNFGDVELWEVVHRAKWQRFPFGHALYSKGEEGNTFHIIAQGEVEVTALQLGVEERQQQPGFGVRVQGGGRRQRPPLRPFGQPADHVLVDRLHLAAPPAGQRLDLPRSRGSRTSRTESPRKLKASTVRLRAMAGMMSSQGAAIMYCRPWMVSMPPQVARGGGAARPRKLRVASVTMAAPMLVALMTSLLAFTVLFVYLLSLRVYLQRLHARSEAAVHEAR